MKSSITYIQILIYYSTSVQTNVAQSHSFRIKVENTQMIRLWFTWCFLGETWFECLTGHFSQIDPILWSYRISLGAPSATYTNAEVTAVGPTKLGSYFLHVLYRRQRGVHSQLSGVSMNITVLREFARTYNPMHYAIDPRYIVCVRPFGPLLILLHPVLASSFLHGMKFSKGASFK